MYIRLPRTAMNSGHYWAPAAKLSSPRGSGRSICPRRMCSSGYDTARDDLPFRAIALLFLRLNTVITMKPTLALALLGTLAFGGTASAQKTVEGTPPHNAS